MSWYIWLICPIYWLSSIVPEISSAISSSVSASDVHFEKFCSDDPSNSIWIHSSAIIHNLSSHYQLQELTEEAKERDGE
ncbi:unnamed protein product [Litomosoides sigmodontis]|uniref:Uncharacterized protein n=1 Tax=Litomosoides sigmodontis TaxID=42156 RepID=A0A3P7M605_LITSI|nr:unnamed protein product [Litomosoides sigmodontis]